MKKVLSCLSALLLVFSMSITAFAEDSYIFDTTPDAQAQSTLTYTVNSNYGIIIPEMINGNDSFRFTANYVRIRDDEQVNVYAPETVTLTNEAGNSVTYQFNARLQNNCVGYFLKDQLESPYYVNGGIPEYNADAGTYSGVVTFTVELKGKGQF